ncbi:MAG: phage holin family protein [Acidimicrobiia bacterium]
MRTEARELPDLVRDLWEMSKEYLRQETLDPTKRMGRHAGFGLGGAALVSLAGLLFTFAAYALLRRLLPDTPWWAVGARFITFLLAAAAAGIIVWRMKDDRDEI